MMLASGPPFSTITVLPYRTGLDEYPWFRKLPPKSFHRSADHFTLPSFLSRQCITPETPTV
jgi:hypothetical protein